uniref:(northern house mosquito) hypothetical protein n=1 Tax=Culex pipiens TaxID=7175 RepID=A0A8D8DID5_CULPI
MSFDTLFFPPLTNRSFLKAYFLFITLALLLLTLFSFFLVPHRSTASFLATPRPKRHRILLPGTWRIVRRVRRFPCTADLLRAASRPCFPRPPAARGAPGSKRLCRFSGRRRYRTSDAAAEICWPKTGTDS